MKNVQNIFSVKINNAIYIEDESYECEKCIYSDTHKLVPTFQLNVKQIFILNIHLTEKFPIHVK